MLKTTQHEGFRLLPLSPPRTTSLTEKRRFVPSRTRSGTMQTTHIKDTTKTREILAYRHLLYNNDLVRSVNPYIS